ncbi:hypothetical protein ABVT39_011370 [Epinephelus coioides]
MEQERNSWRPQGPTLQGQVRQLSNFLKQERAQRWWEYNMRLQLSRELEDTRQQLSRQKNLKEMLIIKEKDTRNELERLKRLCDPETVNTMRLATEIQNNIKTKKKKVLLKEFVDLKVAYAMSQESFSIKLQAEKDKNKALQQELKQLKSSHQINLSYEAQLKAEKGKSDGLQKQQNEIQSRAEKVSEDVEAIKQLVAEETIAEREKLFKELDDLMSEKDTLVQQIKEEIELEDMNEQQA